MLTQDKIQRASRQARNKYYNKNNVSSSFKQTGNKIPLLKMMNDGLSEEAINDLVMKYISEGSYVDPVDKEKYIAMLPSYRTRLQEKEEQRGITTQNIEKIENDEEGKGFFSSVGKSFNSRLSELKETWSQTAQLKISPIETGLQTVGKSLGFVGDIVGSGVINLAKALTPDVMEEYLGKQATKLLQTDIGQGALNALDKSMEVYGEWKKEHPRFAKNLESIIDIADLYPGGVIKKALSKSALIQTTKGVAKEVAKEVAGSAVGQAVKKVGGAVKDVTKSALKKSRKVVRSSAEFLVSQATALQPKVIRTIIDNPGKVTKAMKKGLERSTVVHRVREVINKRLDELSSLGKEYNIIKQSKDVVEIPKENVLKHLKDEFKLDIDDTGKLIRTSETVAMKEADLKGLQDFIDLYVKQDVLNGNEFLNARQALSQLAKFDSAKTDTSSRIAKSLRKFYDNKGKDALAGLKELDSKFAPEIKALNLAKKDFINPLTGELKDNAYSKIANISNNVELLKRLEVIYPGIGKEVNILNAIEAVKIAQGKSVGSYTRSAIQGGGLLATAGVVTGTVTGTTPILVIIAAIVSMPSIATEILIKYGKTKGISTKIIKATVEAMEKGVKLTPGQAKLFREAIEDKAFGLQTGKEAIEELNK